MKKINLLALVIASSLLSSCDSLILPMESNSTESVLESIIESLSSEYSSSEIESITQTITETLSSFDSSSETSSISETSSTEGSPSESSSESSSESQTESSSESSSSISSSSSSSSSGEILGLEDSWTNDDFGTYYDSIDLTKIDTALLTSLQKLNSSKRKSTVGYKNMWSYYNKTDYDPKNTSQYIAFYRGTSAAKSAMNKEHVWPNSRGGGKVENDIHMPRPTLTADNSGRGNSFYVEGKNTSSQGWDPKTAGMKEVYRGIAARIIFYCVVADSSLKLADVDYISNNQTGYNCTMGKLSDLLKWNLAYEVQDSEHIRNKGAQGIQGNRNPFIDNPGFACAIWGGTNSKTKQICGRK